MKTDTAIAKRATEATQRYIGALKKQNEELLEACKDAVHQLRKVSAIGMADQDDDRLNRACGVLQAAITAAEGEAEE